MVCEEIEAKMTLYLYGELPDSECAAVEEHFAACADCARHAATARRLQQLLNQQPVAEPAPELLVHCRQALEVALDYEQLGWHSLLRDWTPALSLSHPSGIVAVVGLVIFGFGLGWTLRPQTGRVHTAAPAQASSQATLADLSGARISAIRQVAPDPETGGVKITLDAEHRVTMEGSLDDPRIRDVMLYALRSYSNPGIRLDTLEALRSKVDTPAVQPAFLYVLQHDPNLGLRMEALNAVRKTDWNPEVRGALLNVVEHDKNPGLRGAVVDELSRRALQQHDLQVIQELQRLAETDSDRYVRQKSLSALVALGAAGP